MTRLLPSAPDDATLGAIIAQGIPGTEMPENFAWYRKVISMPDNYLQVQIAGARVDEDTLTIQIRDAAARIYLFPKDELKESHKDRCKYPMPRLPGRIMIAYLATTDRQSIMSNHEKA